MEKLELTEAYFLYLKARKLEDIESINCLREQIALILLNNPAALDWYITRLKSRGYGFAPTYLDVALSCENKKYVSSLAETTVETVKRLECLKTIETYLLQFKDFQFLVIGGSFPWKRYLSLKERSTSDLDLLLVSEKYDSSMHFNNDQIERLINKFICLADDKRPEMIKFKIRIAGIEVSIHWWDLATFKKIIDFDYEQITEPFILKCFRSDPSSKTDQGYGPQYNFIGDQYYFDLDSNTLDTEIVSNQHIAMIGNEGEFVLGAALDMMLFGSMCIGPKTNIYEAGIEKIIESLRRRKALERKVFPLHNLSFVNLPARKKYMPNNLLSAISQWDVEHD